MNRLFLAPVLASLLLACGGAASSSAENGSDAVIAATGPTPGPLVVSPAFVTDDGIGFMGISNFTNMMLDVPGRTGFSPDSKLYATCNVAMGAPILTKECVVVEAGSGAYVDGVASRVDYGDGQSAAKDPACKAVLDGHQIPAAAGAGWKYASDLELTWREKQNADGETVSIDVAVRDKVTQKSVDVAHFEPTTTIPGLSPDKIELSPDGSKIAVVIYRVGGPPLLAEAVVLDADTIAKTAYRAAGHEARADAIH